MVKIVSSYLAEFVHVIGISMRYLSKCNDLIVQNYLIISRLQITQNNALPNNNEKNSSYNIRSHSQWGFTVSHGYGFLGAFRRPAFGPHRAPLLHSHPTLRHHHSQGVDGEEEKGGILQTADTTLSYLKNVERNHSTPIVHCKLTSKREKQIMGNYFHDSGIVCLSFLL